MLIISWKRIVVGDSFVFMGDDCCRFVHIFYCFEDFWWILDEFMVEFGFSGRMPRVHFVVNLLLMRVVVVACSMRRL